MKFENIAKECRTTHKGNIAGVPIVGLEHIEPGDMLLKHWDVDVETTFTKSFKKGQILFGRRRAYQHKACVATCDGICSGDITVIEPIKGAVYPDLLPFIIQNDAFFDHAIKGSNGALSPRVKWEHMTNYEFSLPPIEEQKVLADKLWAAYEVKQSYQNMIDATNQMVKAKFVEMFGGEDIKTFKLGEIVEVKDDCRKPINEGERSTMKNGDLYPYYGATGIVDYINDYLTDERLLCIAEDCGNYGANEDSSYIINGKAWVNNHAHVVKTKEMVDIYYLHHFLKVTNLSEYVSGTTRKKLTQKMMVSIPVPLPSMDQQKVFVQIVEQAETSIARLNDSIAAIDRVIRSLINENL